MSDHRPMTDEPELLIASRGNEPGHGLIRATLADGRWELETLGHADQLSALAWHPQLPVVYGTAGVNRVGQVLAWRIDDDGGATVIGDTVAGENEFEPCHLSVDPNGTFLAVTNYTSGKVALWRLDGDGGLMDPPLRITLTGSGPETARQDGAHPHQAVFERHEDGVRMYIVDLGADLVRVFHVDATGSGVSAEQVHAEPVPPGTGPRHMVVLPDGRLAVSGELGSTLITGSLDGSGWAVVPSTTRSGPARTRHERNYPGDIQRSADGRHVYFANRGYDTITVFDVTREQPELVAELDSAVRWPQHILVRDTDILVAGWDSSQVVSLPYLDGDGGVVGEAEVLLDVPSPGWILPSR